LPGREGSAGVTAADNRLFVEAVLRRNPVGIPWRGLPKRFGDWKNVHRRCSRGSKSGVRERIFQHLTADADNEYAMIDSTIVHPHHHSACGSKSFGEGQAVRLAFKHAIFAGSPNNDLTSIVKFVKNAAGFRNSGDPMVIRGNALCRNSGAWPRLE
jgi:transposase